MLSLSKWHESWRKRKGDKFLNRTVGVGIMCVASRLVMGEECTLSLVRHKQ